MKKYYTPKTKAISLEAEELLAIGSTEKTTMNDYTNNHNNGTGKGNAWTLDGDHVVDKHGNDHCDNTWGWYGEYHPTF